MAAFYEKHFSGELERPREELIQELEKLRRRIAELSGVEEKLEECEDRYRDLVENADIGILIDDPDGRFKYFNNKFIELFGYTYEEMKEQSIQTLVHPEDLDRVLGYHRRRINGEDVPARYEFRGVRKDGSVIYLEVDAIVLKKDGEIVGSRSYLWNIGERKEMERKLREARDSLEKKVAERTAELAKTNRLLQEQMNECHRVEEALKKSEKEKTVILDSITELVVYHDTDFRIIWANTTASKSFGLPQKELTGKRCYEIWQGRKKPCVDCPVKAALETGEFQEREIKMPDGREWFIKGYPVKDEKGTVMGVVEVALDISVIKKAERELADSELQYHALFDRSLLCIVIHDFDGRIIDANDASLKLLGYTREELSSLTIMDVVDKAQLPQINKLMEEIKENGAQKNLSEFRLKKKNGEYVWVESEGTLLYKEGKPYAIQGIVRDITARKRIADALIESEALYRSIVEHSHAGVLIIDENFRFSYVNDELCKILGYPADEILGKNFRMFLDEESRDMVAERYLRRQRGEDVPSRYEFNVVRKNGEVRRVEISVSVIRDHRGKKRTVAQLLDITERRQTEELQFAIYKISEAAHSAENLQSLYHSIHQIIGNLMEAKNFYIALYDKTTDIISFPYFVDEYDERPAPRRMGKGLTEYVIRTGEALFASPEVFRELVKNGEVEPIGTPDIDWLGVPLKIADRIIGVLVVQSYTEGVRYTERDIDILRFVSEQIAMVIERKRTDDALKESRERYKTLTDNVNVGIYRNTAGPNGKFIEANPAMVRMFGYDSKEELLSINVSQLYQNYEDRQAFNEKMLKQGFVQDEELKLRRKDGTPFYCSVSAVAVYNDAGEIIYYDGIVEDITERKKAERSLKESYEKLQKVLNGTVHALASTTEKRDPYTAGHQHRVAQLACAIARELDFPQEQIEGIRVAGLVHDIGKIYVAAEILNKPVKLKNIEMELIKAHCEAGYDILKAVEFPWPVAKMVLQHHEKLDGSGYPQGLSGDDIIPGARILAVADVVEAMSSHRPYRSALGLEEALDEIKKNRGKFYDEKVVDACLKVFEKGFEFK